MIDRRLGKFYITRQLAFSDIFLSGFKLLDFVPTRGEYLHHMDAFEYRRKEKRKRAS